METYASRRAIRQAVASEFGDGLSSITTSGGTATALNDTARAEVGDGNGTADYWRGADVLALDGTNAGLSRRVTANTAGVSLTTAAMPNVWANTVNYELAFNFTFTQYNNAIDYAVRRARGNHWIPWFSDSLVIVDGTQDYLIPARHEITTITADAGSTTLLLRDSVLTQANDYWNGARVVCLSATNAANVGIVRYASDFLAATDDLVFGEAWPAAISAADTFHLVKLQPNYLWGVEYLPTGSTSPVALASRDLVVVPRLSGMYMRFFSIPPVGSTVRVYGVRAPEPPSHDLHPVEVPYDFALNMARWQILRSNPRRADFKLNADEQNKREAFDEAMTALSKGRYQRPADAKKVY